MNGKRLFGQICQVAKLTSKEAEEVITYLAGIAANAVLNTICKVFKVESLTELSENLCNSFKNISEDVKTTNQRIDDLPAICTSAALPPPQPDPVNIEVITNDAATKAKQLVLDSDEFKQAVSAEIRALLSGKIPDDLLAKLAIAPGAIEETTKEVAAETTDETKPVRTRPKGSARHLTAVAQFADDDDSTKEATK